MRIKREGDGRENDEGMYSGDAMYSWRWVGLYRLNT